MNELRKASLQALAALRNAEIVYMEQLNAMYALQEALDKPELDTQALVDMAVLAEREECAAMVDHILKEGSGTYGDAIRARGKI